MRESEFPSIGRPQACIWYMTVAPGTGSLGTVRQLVRTHNDGCDRVLTRQMKGSYLTDEDLEGSPVGKTLT